MGQEQVEIRMIADLQTCRGALLHCASACCALIALVIAVAPGVVGSQLPTKHVYQVKADGCARGQRARVLTGFRESGERGIVTALHGVVGCRTIKASNASDSDDLGLLRIVAVDIEKDLARVSSPMLDNKQRDGISAGTAPLAGANLRVIGYPHGIPTVLVSSLRVRSEPRSRITALFPISTPLAEFKHRSSPSPETTVLSIEGHLTIGHSGAPIVNANGQVVGIANGGLASGATEISWAIPYPGANWRDSVAEAQNITRIGYLNAAALFAFASEAPEFEDVSCLGRAFNFIRAATLADLLTTVDDPATYQSLIQMTGLHGVNLTYLLYRDLQRGDGNNEPELTLAVPEGWTVGGTSSSCIATAPGYLGRPAGEAPISVQFDLRSISGPNPSAQIQQIVLQTEVNSFFQHRYIIDPFASNASPNRSIHRGLIAIRKTYIKIDRRCGPAGPQAVLPEKMTPDIWLQLAPVGSMVPHCAFGQVAYPDIWVPALMPRIPPEYISEGGFGSYMASDERVLLNTVRITDANFQASVLRCTEQLSRSPACRAAYLRQRQWAAALIAATVSTLTPPES